MSNQVPTRCIGTGRVFPIGLGCMNLSHAYGVPPGREQAERVLNRALELGVTHFDCAALYGFGRNEALLGEVLAPHRARIHLTSKCGMTGVNGKRVIDGRPKSLLRTLDESLSRLRTDHLDLWYLHRWDKSVPIEESVGAMAAMVQAGKARALGLSEVSTQTLRRAQAIHPIAAVQSEYSLWTRDPERAVLEECRRIGAAFVAFGPVARGFLAGAIEDPAQFTAGDIRIGMPRFQEPAWSANRSLLRGYLTLADEAGCTPAQLAIAWLLQKAPHVIPIPGTTSVSHLEENIGAAHVRLSPELAQKLEFLMNGRTVAGARYAQATLQELDTEPL